MIEIAAQSRGRGGDHQIMSVTVEILYFSVLLAG